MGKLKLLSIITFLALSFQIESAAPTYKQLTGHISKNKKEIGKLSKNIDMLESRLAKSNKKYLRTLKRKNSIETSIYKMKQLVLDNTTAVNNQLKEARSLVRATLANSLGGDQSAQDLYSQKVLLKAAQKKIKGLKQKLVQLNLQKRELTKLEERFNEYHNIESSLLSAMSEMEIRKKSYAEKYLDLQDEQKKLLKKSSQIKISRVRNKESQSLRSKLGMFSTPITRFTKFEYRKKGVTFHFDEQDFIRLGRGGRVAHTGKLSSYGNVVVIDHGKETRSVFLGEFTPSVRKNQVLKVGDIVGETKVTGEKAGKVYFEVRKKNKAQNTIYLLDKKELEKLAKI
ncbi:MAG: peptidoglycan DD-metalloendopeptidase family protein [Oligoflexia bacterium]|nr:peptidoglycan DD-metalloendopeptidase family protein [Oligoflexia bacterium]